MSARTARPANLVEWALAEREARIWDCAYAAAYADHRDSERAVRLADLAVDTLRATLARGVK